LSSVAVKRARGKLLTALFLALLVTAWIAILTPALMRARRTAPLTTTERFKRGMEVLAEPPATTDLRRVVVEPEEVSGRTAAIERVRRQRAILLLVLLAAAPVTLVAAALLHGGWWEIHIAVDFTLALYVAGLLEAKRRRVERRVKVRSIHRRKTSDAFDQAHAYGGR
jgi:hypothetical protein